MIARTVLLLLVAIASTAIAVGCGDDDSSADSGGDPTAVETSSLTKAEYTKQVDAICAKGSEDLLEKLTRYMTKHESSSKSEGEQTAEGVQKTILPEVEDQIEEIHDLGAPSGDEAQIEAFLAAMQQSVDSLERKRSISLDTDLNQAFSKSGDLARQYGIEFCAYG